jgi:hypothetical protein
VTNKARPPLEETINQLSQPQLHLYASRERVRLEQERRAMEQCTFKPRLCEGTEKRVKTKVMLTTIPSVVLVDGGCRVPGFEVCVDPKSLVDERSLVGLCTTA